MKKFTLELKRRKCQTAEYSLFIMKLEQALKKIFLCPLFFFLACRWREGANHQKGIFTLDYLILFPSWQTSKDDARLHNYVKHHCSERRREKSHWLRPRTHRHTLLDWAQLGKWLPCAPSFSLRHTSTSSSITKLLVLTLFFFFSNLLRLFPLLLVVLHRMRMRDTPYRSSSALPIVTWLGAASLLSINAGYHFFLVFRIKDFLPHRQLLKVKGWRINRGIGKGYMIALLPSSSIQSQEKQQHIGKSIRCIGIKAASCIRGWKKTSNGWTDSFFIVLLFFWIVVIVMHGRPPPSRRDKNGHQFSILSDGYGIGDLYSARPTPHTGPLTNRQEQK